MENVNEKYKNIKGWGVDIDLKNEPNYPIKKYNGDDHKRLNWERPPLQPVTVKYLNQLNILGRLPFLERLIRLRD